MDRVKQGGAHRGWCAVTVIVGAGVVSAIQVGKATAAMDEIRADLMLDIGTASMILSVFALIGALGGAAIGMAVDRIGDRRMAIAGLVLQALGAAIGGLAPEESVLLAARVLEGLGFLAVVVAAPAMIARLAPPGRLNGAMALWATFMPVGLALIMAATPLLSAISWRDLWLGNAALLGAYAVFVAATISRPPAVVQVPGIERSILADIAAALRAGPPLLLAVIFSIYAALFFAVFGFLPSLLSERLALGPELAGPVAGLTIASGIVGNLACGRMLRGTAPPAHILTAGFAIMAVTGCLFFWMPLPALPALILCILFALVGGVVPVVLFDAAPRFAPGGSGGGSLVGATMGLIMQGNNIGLLVGPPLAGGLATTFGWPSVAFLVAGLTGVAALCVIVFARLDRAVSAIRRSESFPGSSGCPDRKPASTDA